MYICYIPALDPATSSILALDRVLDDINNINMIILIILILIIIW